MKNRTILIVSDKAEFANRFIAPFTQEGFAVVTVAEQNVFASIHKEQPVLLVLDDTLPLRSGRSLFRQIRRNRDIPIPILLVTEKSANDDLFDGAWLFSRDHLLLYNFNPLELLAFVRRMVMPTDADSWTYAELREHAGEK